MKRCTWCGKEYPDETEVCLIDRQPLTSGSPSPENVTEAYLGMPWPRQIVIPAVLWMIVNILLAGLFGIGGTFGFSLATALWAAIDSSKLQSKGSRLLGIAFKPVVVFAVCAFFLWGFGFIWYLIMRHRVLTAPVFLEDEGEKVAFGEA